jgi:hypothetical protein
MKKLVQIMLFVCLLTSLSQAQNRADIGLQISTSSGVGYQNPNLGVAGRVIRGEDEFAFDVEGSYFFRAHKYTGDGKAFQITPLIRYYLPNNIFLTGGLNAGRQFAGAINKTSVSAVAGFGAVTKHGEARFYYQFPDSTRNKLQGVTFDFEHLKSIGESAYVAIRPRLQFVRYRQNADTFTGSRVGITVSVGRKR